MNRILRRLIMNHIKQVGIFYFLSELVRDYPIVDEGITYMVWSVKSKHTTQKREGKIVTIEFELE